MLLVDEDGSTPSVLAEDLARVGAQVSRSHDPEEAIRLLQREPVPSLVVVDLRMRSMKAWGFLREKSREARTAGVPTVLVAAPVTEGAVFDARAAGVIGHVDGRAGAEDVLRFRDQQSRRRVADGQLLRAWYRSDLLGELSEALADALELRDAGARGARARSIVRRMVRDSNA